MDLFLNRKSFVIKSLALTVTALMMSGAHAATSDKAEIQQLRKEVEALKALIQRLLLLMFCFLGALFSQSLPHCHSQYADLGYHG